MKTLQEFILSNSENRLIQGSALTIAAELFHKTLKEVEIASLKMGIVPQRYKRNIGTISVDQQIKLLSSRCVVVGCGGLGGYIIEELARLGVGTIVAVDPDVFQESNLNRQLLANIDNIGLPKVEVAKGRVGEVNPAVEFVPHRESFDNNNALSFIEGANIVMDALDNFETRRALIEACSQTKTPLVGGSIAGWYGIAYYSCRPSVEMEALFARQDYNKGIEEELGNPVFIPALVGSIESALACKILVGDVRETNGKVFFFDTLNMSLESFEM